MKERILQAMKPNVLEWLGHETHLQFRWQHTMTHPVSRRRKCINDLSRHIGTTLQFTGAAGACSVKQAKTPGKLLPVFEQLPIWERLNKSARLCNEGVLRGRSLRYDCALAQTTCGGMSNQLVHLPEYPPP